MKVAEATTLGVAVLAVAWWKMIAEEIKSKNYMKGWGKEMWHKNKTIWAQVTGRAPGICQALKNIQCPNILDHIFSTIAIVGMDAPSI